MTGGELLAADVGTFRTAWVAMSEEERAALPAIERAKCYERFLKSSPYDPRAHERKSRAEGHSASSTVQTPAPAGSSPRHEIEVVPGMLPAMVGQAIDALIASSSPIYERAGRLVRPVLLEKTEVIAGVRRELGALVLRPVTAPWLMHELGQVVRWRRYDSRSRGLRDVEPPARIAETIIDAPDLGHWRKLRGVIRAPMVMPDGRVISAAGFDVETGILSDWEGEWSIPAQPTRDDAADALNELQQLLRNFPFATDIDRAVAIALQLTALERPALDAAPGVLVRSPEPGTGKSLLVACSSIIATGTRAAVMDWGDDATESAKRIDGAMLAGDPILAIDNAEGSVGGAPLCQLLSESGRRVRPLGASELVSVPCTATVAITGNNLVVKGDAVRRVIVCNLDAHLERPELRAIAQDLLAETRERRRELVRAALTIVLAYLQAGSPDLALSPLGGYSEWTRLVRSSLAWCCGDDVVVSMEKLRAEDPHRAAMAAVYTAWHESIGSEALTSSEIVQRGETVPALRAALMLVAAPRGNLDTRALGAWCRYHRDRQVGGLRLIVKGETRTGLHQWAVERLHR